jgi:acyl phosphate:glycerol-3-phosphate acyltransferase
MTPAGSWAACLAAGFLLGSFPFGLWWGRLLRGVDVRQHGSRNLGATNVFRVLGPAHGVAVLLLDAAKGAAAVLLAWWIGGGGALPLLAGLCAVLGHVFSPWVRFRGGKGVATGLGVWVVVAPVATALALGVWGGTLALTRRVSPASLLASLVLPPAVWWTGPPEGRALPTAIAAAIAILLWVRHWGNVRRLLRGEEPPLWGKR